ncbi:FimV/HubP family polar landmark protein [Succinivibrio sp.]|uniref:FimV/HubP family polar landmark protein n=1 Tax=Succinivibrio sp. TaxID=2053619 RepID=UPI0038705CCA
MHWLKKNSLVTALCLLFPLCALSADEDGTFTITIQGPETEQVAPVNQTRRAATPRRRQTATTQTPAAAAQQRATATVSPNTRRTVQRVQNLPASTPNQANAAPFSNQTTNATTNAPVNYRSYAIKSGDTIWSIASSFIPEDKSVNEFQIIASIYRNNPNAFANSNVNNLLKTTIKVPDSAEIAREDEKVGGRLLKQGSLVMPPLKARIAATVQNTNLHNQYVSAEKRPDDSQNEATLLSGKDLNKNDVSGDEDIPSYTAMEAKVKELQEKKEQEELNRVIPVDGAKQDQVKQDSIDKLQFAGGSNDIDGTKQKTVKEQVENPPVIIQIPDGHQQSLDVDAIKIMLEGNKTALEEKTKAIEAQMAEVMDRVKKTSAATAKTAADSVATLANQYDHIIANIQQDLIEIKGNLTKLSQDNERIREMVLANDEKLEDMMLQISNYTVNASDSGVDLNRPIMFILFGTGLLSLVLLIIFFIFKKQNRDRAYTLGDDFDVEDSSSENMLLTDENSVFEFDAPLEDSDDEPIEEQKQSTENANAIDAPSDNVKQSDLQSQEVENTDSSQSGEDNAQKAWDEAANTDAAEENKNSKDVMDDWSQALSEQHNAEQSTVDVDNGSSDMADWNEALKEQAADKTDDSQISDGNDLSAWDEALKEQSGEKDNTGESDNSSDMSAWDEALKEQSAQSSDDSADDVSSDAEGESNDAIENESVEAVEPSADLAAWDEAVNSPKSDASDDKFSEDRVIPDETENLDSLFPDENNKSRSSNPHENVKLNENMTEADAIAAAMASAMNAQSLDDTKSPDLSNAHDENEENTEQTETDADTTNQENADIADIEDVADESNADIADIEDIADESNTDIDVNEQIENTVTENTDSITDNSDSQIDELNEALADSNSADNSENLSEDNSEDLSDEEKSLLDSLNKADTTDKSVIPSEDEAVQIAKTEVLTNAQHDASLGIGSNVDTVLDDDLDLESLLDEDSNDDNSQSDASIENAKIDTDNSLIQEEATEDTQVVTDDTDQDLVSDTENEDISESVSEDATDDIASSDENLSKIDSADTQVTDEAQISEDNDDTKTVSWNVPEDEDEIVENEMNHSVSESDSSKSVEELESSENDETSDSELQSSKEDLQELEARIGSAGSMYDPEADNDIMNMLSNASSDETAASDDSFSSDDITNMLQSASKSTPDISSRINEIKSSVETDEKINENTNQDNVLEQVFDRIGPITAIDEEPFENDISAPSKELTAKEHQYYVDELNLARLYFETGDTEEAIKIIDDVKEHGSDDLKQEALKIIESYGN